MNYRLLLEKAITASIEAGDAIMDVYNGAIEVEYKDDESPLTIADQKANDVIVSHLEGTNIPIISEENKQVDFEIRKQWNSCWIVDPLDGTKEFMKRNGEFTVNIALVTQGKPELGVIYVPATRTIYFAIVSEKDAYKSQINNREIDFKSFFVKPTRIEPAQNNSTEIRVVGSRSHMNQDTQNFVEELGKSYKTVEIVSKGSSLKFCLVAEGKADLYPRFAPTMEWDTAAGQAICNSAGIKVISQESEEEMLYNKENLLNSWFLVSR